MRASRTLEIGEEHSARFADYAVGFVSGVAEFAASCSVIADTVGNMRHNPVERERIRPIGFGIGQGLAEGVVVLGGFH